MLQSLLKLRVRNIFCKKIVTLQAGTRSLIFLAILSMFIELLESDKQFKTDCDSPPFFINPRIWRNMINTFVISLLPYHMFALCNQVKA